MKKKRRDSCSGGAGNHQHHQLIGLRHLLQAAILCRRRFYGHLFPLLSALTGCLLLFLAALNVLSPPPVDSHFLRHHTRRYGGEVVVQRNLTAFRVQATRGTSDSDLWSTAMSSFYYGCSNSSQDFATADRKTEPNRYLLIATSGGLNQQRTGITDAVVVAYILNATLVVPKLDQKSFWKDTSDFAEIFDVEWFTSFLSKDVKIIKELPKVSGKALNPYTTRVPRKCTPSCYQSRILPMLIKRHAVQLTKFDYRLSNRLDKDLQKLRCRANYHALRFTNPILDMGKKLVERMRMKSKHFIALHLRYEPDMLAFSQCYYGGGDKEKKELGKIRKRWKTLHASDPDKVRRHGRCPLTPEEVGLMLKALGYESDTHIYVASGEVYGGEETLAPLKALFPNFYSKETIASKEELAPFSSFSSRMAALDFIVCDESDVFVTNNNGNMAKMLAGRRRYFGHKPTIRPNAKKLYRLFMNRNNMTWEEFSSRVRNQQIGFMGEPNEMKPGTGVFHENPASCLCEDPEAKAKEAPDPQHGSSHSPQITRKENNTRNGAAGDFNEYEDDQDWGDIDYEENGNGFRSKGQSNVTDLNPKVLSIPERLEEIFSD